MNENEERFTDAAAVTHVIITRKTLHVDGRGRRYLLGVITDITALHDACEALKISHEQLELRIRERTEELSAANARLRQHDAQRAAFLNVLGHELRNPIAAIHASAALMERLPPGSSASARALAVVGRQLEHLTRMCDDLLDTARVAHGKLELQRRVLELGVVVGHVCEDLASAFASQGVVLAFARPDDRVWVDADATRLAQAIGNLLHNALKFTPAGGRVDLTVRRAGGRVELVVRDTGAGMRPDEIERMFEPYVQAAEARGRAHGGLGIGLPLAKGLVEAHGGTLTARSEGPGRGVEVMVALPSAAAPPPEPAPERPAPAAGDRVVLVIDDEADFRESLATLLRLEGYRVEVAVDARSGVAAARALRPDVVLCDLGLPDLDGRDVARALRADADPAVATSRLVALSGFVHPEDAASALEAGFDAHLPKPPSLERLAEVLGEPGGSERRRAPFGGGAR